MTDDQPARADRDGEAEDAGGELMSKGGDNLQHRRRNAEHRLGGAGEQQDDERGLRRLRAMAEQAEQRPTARPQPPRQRQRDPPDQPPPTATNRNSAMAGKR